MCKGKGNMLFAFLFMFMALCLFPCNRAYAQVADGDCIMDMTTKADTIAFYAGSSSLEGGVLKVDLGDGVVKDFELAALDTIYIKEKVVSENVKVYGSKTLVTFFQCINTGLTTLDASGSENLEILICSHNLIEDLNVRGNKKLLYLDCEGNTLKTLDIAQNEELQILYAQNNTNLGNIDFSIVR